MSESLTPRQLVEMVTSRPGYTSAVGTRVLHAEAGCVHLAIGKRPDLLQFSGFFHGGVISGLADHAAGGAVTTALPPGRIAVTIDLHVNFLSPADGESIVAKARAVQIGGTVCVANVEVMTVNGSGEERLCALATAAMRVVEMPGKQRAAAS
ncbi:MAG: PaaI family thioesterase [Sulfurifustaceae bacterium]